MLQNIIDWLWTYILIGVLIVCGLWFTWKCRFVQFRMVPEMFRLLLEAPNKGRHGKKISSFQAFAVSVATRVGTGNLAGVATAISIGGPGAVFWMWMIALIGSATAFVESTLAQLYKHPHDGHFIGGPAYYIHKGLREVHFSFFSFHFSLRLGRWMSILFAILITITFGLAYNSVQSNTISGALHHAFGITPLISGIALTLLSLIIVFGGIHRIARVSSVIVPVMAIGYFILAIVIVIMNISLLPSVLRVIVTNAFGIGPVVGGGLGAALMNGIKRGLFSNEAGEGSAPNVAATAHVSHPVKQGLIQALGVFTDTLLVCSCTAFIILISGLYTDTSLQGINLTQTALQSVVGSAGPVFIAIAIFLFAFSSIIGNYYYGEANVRYLSLRSRCSEKHTRHAITCFRIFSGGVFVLFGSLASLETVWAIGDLCMALLTACNLVAIILLGKYAFRLLEDYRHQQRNGIRNPEFHRSQMPDIQDELDAWE
ncbi:MAG: alanine:cation symporter family protein [Bacteroidaceae bacterium]|nr:alanine:cation symporter family protein [Bacteroidaceae bacterium]